MYISPLLVLLSCVLPWLHAQDLIALTDNHRSDKTGQENFEKHARIRVRFEKEDRNPCKVGHISAFRRELIDEVEDIRDKACGTTRGCWVNLEFCGVLDKNSVAVNVKLTNRRLSIKSIENYIDTRLRRFLRPYTRILNSRCHGNLAISGAGEICEICGVGSYITSVRICQVCPRGFYSNEAGVTKCSPCPKGHYTLGRGSESLDNCKRLCYMSITPEHRLQNTVALRHLVEGGITRAVCQDTWYFDRHGTKDMMVDCSKGSLVLPKCTVHTCNKKCNMTTEFQCRMSCNCIPLSETCNGKRDCQDNSDEDVCPLEGFRSKSLQFIPRLGHESYVNISNNWSKQDLSQLSVCLEFRLFLSDTFSSILSLERQSFHALWIQTTRNYVTVQVNGMFNRNLFYKQDMNRKWTKLCLAIDLLRGELKMWVKESGSDVSSVTIATPSVQGLRLRGDVDVVIGGVAHSSHPAYNLRGLVKDMFIWDHLLADREILKYIEDCEVVRASSLILNWDAVVVSDGGSDDAATGVTAQSRNVISQLYYNSCNSGGNFVCETRCPPNTWQCKSCDCIPLQQRCDRVSDHCLDNSDEDGCPLLDGNIILLPLTNVSERENPEDLCLGRGATLAALTTEFEMQHAVNTLVYFDYDNAWATNAANGSPRIFTKRKQFMAFSEENGSRVYAILCQYNRASIFRYHGTPATFAEAKVTCEKEGGHLAAITTLPMLEQIRSILHIYNPRFQSAWVGGAQDKNYKLRWIIDELLFPTFIEIRPLSGRKLSLNPANSVLELRDGSENLPFICQMHRPNNHTTSLLFKRPSSNTADSKTASNPTNLSPFLLDEFLPDSTLCVSFITHKSGVLISYSSSDSNELLIKLVSSYLLILIQTTPVFINRDFSDGYWHTLCATYAKNTLTVFIDGIHYPTNRPVLYRSNKKTKQIFIGGIEKEDVFEGEIVNLNIWKVALSNKEVRYISGRNCEQSAVMRDDSMVLRWGDILSFNTGSASLGSMRHNQQCYTFKQTEELVLEMDGNALVLSTDNQIRKCNDTDEACESVKIKIVPNYDDVTTVIGSRVRLLDNNGDVIACDTEQCILVTAPSNGSHNNHSYFLIKSPQKPQGKHLERGDKFYLTDLTEVNVLDCSGSVCKLSPAESSLNSLDSLLISPKETDKRGWGEWTPSGVCRGVCGSSFEEYHRTCLGPPCYGDDTTTQPCVISSCTKTGKCIGGVYEDAFRGNFSWNSVEFVNYTASVVCPAGSVLDREQPALFKLTCTREGFNTTDIEGRVSVCAFLSKSAQQLSSLLEGDINAENAENVSSQMARILSDATQINSIHLNMVVELTQRLLATENVTLALHDNILASVDAISVKMTEKELLSSDDNSIYSQQLLDSLDKVGNLVDLGDAPAIFIPKESLLMLVDKTNLDEDVGAVFEFTEENSLLETKKALKVAKQQQGTTEKVSVHIPSTLKKSSEVPINRVWFTVHKDTKLFMSQELDKPVVSKILGIGIGGNIHVKNLKDDVSISFTAKPGLDLNPSVECVFWESRDLRWSRDGVETHYDADSRQVTCRTNHLTNFAVLMNVGNIQLTGPHVLILQTITLVGGIISMICLLLTVVGLSKFKIFRKTPTNQIHIALSFSLLMGIFLLIVGLDRTENKVGCTICAVLIHYFYLSSICWMLIEGINLYFAFVKVFTGGQDNFFKKCAIFAFGFPSVVVFISVLVEVTTDIAVYATGQYCWLGYIPSLIAFIGPVILMLLANFVIFAFVIKQIFGRKQTNTNSKFDGFKQLRAVLCLMALMGLTWIVGAFTIDGISGLVFQYTFAITNISQGILIFYFHCASKPDVRNAWLNSWSSGTSFTRRPTLSSLKYFFAPSLRRTSKPVISWPSTNKHNVLSSNLVFNATCNIMGINVPLVQNYQEERNLSSDPKLQLHPVQEDDEESSNKHQSLSNSFASHLMNKGGRNHLGTVVPMTTGRTYSTDVKTTASSTIRSRYNPSRFGRNQSPRSPRTDHIYQRVMKSEDDSPLFPPSVTPPPPPSSRDSVHSKDSVDVPSSDSGDVSPPPQAPATPPSESPDLHTPPMTPTQIQPFQGPSIPVIQSTFVSTPRVERSTPDIPDKDTPPVIAPETPPIVPEKSVGSTASKPVGEGKEEGEMSPEPLSPLPTSDEDSYRDIVHEDNVPTQKLEKSFSGSDSPRSDKEMRGYYIDSDEESTDDDDDFGRSDEFETPDGDRDIYSSYRKKPLSWEPSEKEQKKRDVQIARVKSFGTVKESFEHDDRLNPDRYKKRRQSLKSPCLPMKSLRGKFEAQNTTQMSLTEEDEEDSSDQAAQSTKPGRHSQHGDKRRSNQKNMATEEE